MARKALRFFVGLTLATVVVPTWPGRPTAAAQETTIGLRLFGEINFKGRTASFLHDTPNLESAGMAGVVSSLRVASGETWQICTEVNYGGVCRIVTEDISDLRRRGLNDRILSVRFVRIAFGAGGPSAPSGPIDATTPGLHLWADVSFRGPSGTLTTNTPDVSRRGMTGMISSLRVGPDEVWQVCAEPDYRGRCDTVSGDVTDLRRTEWNDLIRSARRIRGPRPLGAGGIERGLQVFADVNHRGRSATFLTNTPDVAAAGMGGLISSLRVAPGEVWQVCSETGYRGRCQVIESDFNDLRRGEWNDVIASARRLSAR